MHVKDFMDLLNQDTLVSSKNDCKSDLNNMFQLRVTKLNTQYSSNVYLREKHDTLCKMLFL